MQFVLLVAMASALLIVAAVIESKIVECSGGEWFGFLAYGDENSTTRSYSDVKTTDTMLDSVSAVAQLAWPAMSLSLAGLIFAGLLFVNLLTGGESARFELVVGIFIFLLYLMSALLSTLVVSRAGVYVTESTCMLGRDTYLLWAGSLLMIVGIRALWKLDRG